MNNIMNELDMIMKQYFINEYFLVELLNRIKHE